MSPKLSPPNIGEVLARQAEDIDTRYHPSAAQAPSRATTLTATGSGEPQFRQPSTPVRGMFVGRRLIG